MTTNSIAPSSLPDDDRKQRNRPPPEIESSFAASLAHEINSPLEAILGLLYLIETKVPLAENGHHYLALAREEIRRISQILHAAMDDFRNTEGPEDTNVPELLRSVLEFYRSRIESHGISINATYCKNGILLAYPHQLRQMFSNLLLNAADAMPDGGKMQARISLAHEWSGRMRRGLRLTLADNGSGIAAKDLPRILDPFFSTKGAAGNGIGLSLVNNTVQKHHGVLHVRSSTRPGRSGTVFEIFLPAEGPELVRRTA